MESKRETRQADPGLDQMRREMANFLRKPLLQRTPPRRRSSCSDMPQSDDELFLNPTKKFCAEVGSGFPMDSEAAMIRETLNKLENLRGLVSQDCVDKSKVLDKIGEIVNDVHSLSGTKATSQKKDSSTQCNPEVIEEQRRVFNIRNRIHKDMTREELQALMAEEWPKAAFVCTKASRRSIINSEKTRVLIVDRQDDAWKTVFPSLRSQFPSLGGILDMQLTDGNIIVVQNSDKLSIEGQCDQEDEKPRMMILSFLDEAALLLPTILGKIRSKLNETEHKEICVSILSPLVNELYCRKLLECALVGDNISCELALPKNRRSLNPRPRKQNSDTIIIASEGNKSFAEVVAKMKQDLDPESVGVTVKKVSKTPDGKVKMVIEERKLGGRANMLAEMKKNKEISVNVKRSEKAIIISNLDESVSENELRDSLSKSLGITEEKVISFLRIRKGYRDNYSAVVVLPKDLQERAIAIGTLRVGWTTAKIKAKHSPTCCRKCQRFGHGEQRCPSKEALVAALCRRCGEPGHKAISCENDLFCYSCNVKDHRADSMACPDYRRAVQECKKEQATQKSSSAVREGAGGSLPQ